MKKITHLLLILCATLFSCEERGEVFVLPEFDYIETEITLSKEQGAAKTALIYTTEAIVTAAYTADWLSVDVTTNRAIYQTTSANETGEPRTAVVTLTAGEFSKQVTVTQTDKDAEVDESLRVGQLTEDGLGMIFWVDPTDPKSGKAISLERWGGNPFEQSVKAHGALSTVDGMANTALYLNPAPNDAVAVVTALGEGWYLPASGELLDLFAAYNGVAHTDPAFTNDVPANISETEKAARARFEQALADLGGAPLNAAAETGNGESYWASTEREDGVQARYVRFGKYALDFGAKTGTARFARGMKIIGEYVAPEEPATASVAPSQVALTSESGATGTTTLTSNKSNYIVIIEGEGAEWLTYSQADKIITFTALSENNTGDIRTATVRIVAGTGENTAQATLSVSQQKAISVVPFAVGEYVTTDGGAPLAEAGIVFWVNPTDASKAKIISLQRANLQWTIGFNGALGVTDTADGYANTQIIAQHTNAADIPAIAYCQARGEGWYWPARDELLRLFDAYNGLNEGEPFTNDLPGNISAPEKAARVAFDLLLTEKGGDKLNALADDHNGESYWASTETSTGTSGWYVRFGKYASTNAAKTGSARFVRCVRSVSR